MLRWLALVMVAGCDLVFDVDVPGPNPVGFVQGTAADTSNAFRNETAFLNDTTAGNLAIVGVDWVSASNNLFPSVSDTAGNTYVAIGDTIDVGSLHARLFYAADIAGGPCTVGVELTAIADVIEVYVHEYTGIATDDPLDGASLNSSNGFGAMSSGQARLDHSGDLVFMFGVDGTVTVGPELTVRSTFHNNMAADTISGPPGLYDVKATATSSWSMHMAAFRAAR